LFQVHYRRRFLKKLIAALDREEDFEMDVLKALWLLHRAWNAVTGETIANCFRHAKFIHEEIPDGLLHVEDQGIQAEWTQLQQKGQTEGIDLEQFLTADEDLVTAGEPTLADFIRDHPINSTPSDDDEEAETIESPPITFTEAAKAWEVFQSFMEQNADHEMMKMVEKLDDGLATIRSRRTVQPKVTDFFS
jgi:hypothetical protein